MSETIANPEISTERNTILLGEDDPCISKSIAEILGFLGYEVLQAENGESLISTFAAEKHRIALIITDKRMPVMTGIEALPELRAIDSSIPIVLSSASNRTEENEELTEAGLINGILPKPFDVADLYSIVHEMLE